MTRFDGGREVPLAGGDVTAGVIRVGATVRRPHGPASSAVERVLRHLEAEGFAGAPRWLGRDARERDVLSFVDGEVAGRPWPDWTADEARLVSLAGLVRRYHDAVASLGLPAEVLAVPRPTPPGLPARDAGEPELVGHRDITPENVVFRAGVASALIDFDLVGPSTRVEELANLLLWWGAWMPEEDREPVLEDADPVRRARIALAAYGWSGDPAAVVPVSLNLAERSWHLMRWRADHLGGGWARMWDEGVGDRILRRTAWLADHAEAFTAAVR